MCYSCNQFCTFFVGHIQSIQLGSGQNILAQNIQSTSGGMNNATSNLLGNIQQVQILTSNGQIITKTLPTTSVTEDKTSDNVKISSPGLKVSSVAGTNVTAIRNAISGQQVQMTIAKPQAAKNIKNIKTVSVQSSCLMFMFYYVQ